jgi:hypothetical protein
MRMVHGRFAGVQLIVSVSGNGNIEKEKKMGGPERGGEPADARRIRPPRARDLPLRGMARACVLNDEHRPLAL